MNRPLRTEKDEQENGRQHELKVAQVAVEENGMAEGERVIRRGMEQERDDWEEGIGD